MAFNRRSMFGTLALTCDRLNIERNDIIIDGGGASLYYGLRDKTNDIDVSLDSVIFDRIVKEYNLTPQILPMLGTHPSIELVVYGGVDFHRVENLIDVDRKSHRGFGVQTKLDLLRFRISLGRNKDLDDIRQLENLWDSVNPLERKRIEYLLELVS